MSDKKGRAAINCFKEEELVMRDGLQLASAGAADKKATKCLALTELRPILAPNHGSDEANLNTLFCKGLQNQTRGCGCHIKLGQTCGCDTTAYLELLYITAMMPASALLN